MKLEIKILSPLFVIITYHIADSYPELFPVKLSEIIEKTLEKFKWWGKVGEIKFFKTFTLGKQAIDY